MKIDIKKFVNELKANSEFDVDDTIKALEDHVTAVVHGKVSKAEQQAEKAKTSLLDDIAKKEAEIEDLNKQVEDSATTNESAVAEAIKTIQEQLDTANGELSTFKSEKQSKERAEALADILNPELLEDALLLAKAKGILTDETTNEELVEAMTKFAEEKPMFKKTVAVNTPDNNGEKDKDDNKFDEDKAFDELKKQMFGESESNHKDGEGEFNEDKAFADMRKQMGL